MTNEHTKIGTKPDTGMSYETGLELSKYNDLHGKVALVDGDILVYRCAFVAEHTHYLAHTIDRELGAEQFHGPYESSKEMKELGPEDPTYVWTRKEIKPVEFALEALKTTLISLQDKTKAKEFRIYLSGKSNFRDEVAKTQPYKGNRDAVAKPTYWRACRDYLINNWNARVTEGIEADDAIGIDSYRLGGEGFIVSIDKDLDQIRGWHYNWVSGEVYQVSNREADFCLYSQILSGDSTDNIPGLRGIGRVKADKLLDGCKSSVELFRRAWDTYRTELGVSTPVAQVWDYFSEQADLVYIRRYQDQPWSPPEVPEGLGRAA